MYACARRRSLRLSLTTLALLTVAAMLFCLLPTSRAADDAAASGDAAPAGLTPAELTATANDAYAYFYPLVTMDVTRLQSTNVAEASGFSAPMNQFANVREYPPADFHGVVRPNFDTLYSSLWMDLTEGPMILSLPDSGGRYYLFPALDMWTNVFFSPGTRTTGNAAGDYAYCPPGWQGDLPAGVVRVDAPTPYLWIIGRTQTNGPSDYAAVHEFQNAVKLTPLAQWGQDPSPPPAGHVDPNVDMHTAPLKQVNDMTGQQYFEYAARLMKLHPPQLTDQGMLARLRRIGFEPGEELDFASLPAAVQNALNAAPAATLANMQVYVTKMGELENGWSMNTESMGVYGNNFLRRACVAMVGLGANLPEDAVYPLLVTDGEGHPVQEGQAYSIHFEKDEIPPVDAFWSITLYDADGFVVPNDLDRYAVSSWMPFAYNADGSLDLYFQSESPGASKESNWLPAPATGKWNLTMRLYSPQPAVVQGDWSPPGIEPSP